jgi:hypothetical protein
VRFLDESEAVVSFGDVGLDCDAGLREDFEGFFGAGRVVCVVYCDDEVVLGGQSAGDDEAETGAACDCQYTVWKLWFGPPVIRAFRWAIAFGD